MRLSTCPVPWGRPMDWPHALRALRAAAWRSRPRSTSRSAGLANTQWVVNVYTDWEEHYRGALGAAIGGDKAETRSSISPISVGCVRTTWTTGESPATDTGNAKNTFNHKRYGFKLTGTPSAHVGASNSGSGTPSGLGQSLPSSGPWSLAPRDQATKTLRPLEPF